MVKVVYPSRKLIPRDVTVIVVNYRTLKLTKACIESVRRFMPDCRIITVDNCSKDGSTQYLQHLADTEEDVSIVITKKNVGHGRGLELGARQCKTRLFLILDSDTEVKHFRILPKMIEPFNIYQRVYATGALRLVSAAGNTVNKPEVPYIHPFAALFDRHLYEQLPRFDLHGAPLLKNMRAAFRERLVCLGIRGLGQDIIHHRRGTRQGRRGWESLLSNSRKRCPCDPSLSADAGDQERT